MYKLRLGKSIGFVNDGYRDLLNNAKAEGLESTDFDLCNKWLWKEPDTDIRSELEKGLTALKESGLYFNGVHIPFGRDWDFSDVNEDSRKGAMAKFKEIAPIIDRYSPKCYIIHGSYEPVATEDRAAKIEALKKSLREMLEITKTTLAVEILPRTCLLNTSSEAIAVIDSMNSEQIKVCVDVNHFLQERSEDGVLSLGSRIVTTHISDHDYVNERHWLPGEGKIDWMALISALEKIGYGGTFNYEVASGAAEVKANYDKLFAEYNK